MNNGSKATKKAQGRVVASSAALVAGLAYGLGGTFNKMVAATGFAVGHIAIEQFLLASVILAVATLVMYRRVPTLKVCLQLMVAGAFLGASTLFLYYAIAELSVGQAVAIQFQYVWITLAIQCAIERKRPNAWVVLCALIIIAGSLMGSGLADEFLSGSLSNVSVMGLLLAAACSLSYSCFLYLNSRIAVEEPPLMRTLFLALGGTIVASVATPSFYMGACDVVALLPGGILMAFVAVVLPCACLGLASRSLPGGLVAVLTADELPGAVFSGWLLLGEVVTPLTIVGVVLICVGIVVSETKGRLTDIHRSSENRLKG